MLIIGLTGGVASGKNFVATRLQKLKIPVFDADFEVHKLFANNQEIFWQIKNLFPKVIVNDKIDREILGKEVFGDEKKLKNLEQIIYPYLRKQENLFIKNCRRYRSKIAVLNIPLLFEKNSDKRCDKTIAIIAPSSVRLHRFKKRFNANYDPKIITDKFHSIIQHQISDYERQKRADFLIHSGLSKGFCYNQLRSIIKTCNL